MSVDHLARYHLEMALVLPVPTADVAAIQPNHDRFGSLCALCCAVLVTCGCTTAPSTRNVLFRTVPAFCAPLIGSSSDSNPATWPKGASAAYRAVTSAS